MGREIRLIAWFRDIRLNRLRQHILIILLRWHQSLPLAARVSEHRLSKGGGREPT
jgi:hypothetical protein